MFPGQWMRGPTATLSDAINRENKLTQRVVRPYVSQRSPILLAFLDAVKIL